MEIFGLPAHVLLVHGAVVLTPLAVAVSILFAVHPRSRYLTRWPHLGLAIAATGAVWAARLTGNGFRDQLLESGRITRALVATHAHRGQVLALLMVAFALLAVASAFLLGGPTGLVSGRGERPDAARAVDLGVRVALVLVAILVLVWVVLTGDAGARAAWG